MAPRLTPYELAFPADRFEGVVFPAMREEARARGVDAGERERLLMLASVGEVLRELGPDAESRADDSGTALPPPDAVRDYGALLFHAFRFWDSGRYLLTTEEAVLRDILSRGPIGAWRLSAPRAAGYLQLPRHLVWARISEEAPPEAIDGFFWSVVDSDERRPGRLDLLLALGMHPGRPGFSVIEAAAPLPVVAPGHWGDEPVRPDGDDFANILPGGELRDLLAILSTAELLKMVSRLFHYIDSVPSSLRPVAPVGEGSGVEGEAHALPPSSIPAMIVTHQVRE